MAISKGVLKELLTGYEKPEDLMGKDGILEQLTKALVESALGAELTHHLGYEKGNRAGKKVSNHRNGGSKKTLLGENGPVEIEVPRDREGTFEPQLIRKGQRRFDGFDQKILAMYARGMTVREIQGFLKEQYGTEVSTDLISDVTDAVMEDVKAWQARPLDPMYPLVFMDALRVRIRDEGTVKNKAVYLALGVRRDGCKEVLGLWIEQTEGAKFWLRVVTELKNRGVKSILMAVVDGLKGFPEAIQSVFSETQVQGCIVHLLRNSLEFCSWQDRKTVAEDLKGIYKAPTPAAAADRLAEFEAGPWGKKYPPIGRLWHRAWEQVTPFFAYPDEVRKIIYTTNAIESLNARLRKILKNRGHFPTDEAATKLIYLVLRNISQTWTMPARSWKAAMIHFAILFPEAFDEPAH
jgi:transposase-like protein